MIKRRVEINIDGLIGPTHHFGGLGVGNVASIGSRHRISNPKAAALEGLAKMELLSSLGSPQYYLPPPSRPNWQFLNDCGFRGERGDILKRCHEQSPSLLSAAYSSAFMWTANAATVAPSSDTTDGCLHVVPANLCSNLHRGQEAIERRKQLQRLLSPLLSAQVHTSLPAVMPLRDEGAANHMRLCSRDGTRGVHLFVYGGGVGMKTSGFVARQSELASRSVASALKLDPNDCIFIEQCSQAIDAGVFHNDVIATSHQNAIFFHELAFVDSEKTIASIRSKFESKTGEELIAIRVSDRDFSMAEAVRTYVFNSQLASDGEGGMSLVCPDACRDSALLAPLLESWVRDPSNPIQKIHFVALAESMANGGGPACLRLRLTLTPNECESLNQRFRIDAARLEELRSTVERWYPEQVRQDDLLRLDFAELAEECESRLRNQQ